MRKQFITLVAATALVASPVMFGKDQAHAIDAGDIMRTIIGTAVVMTIAGAIANSVQAGQYHCHPGYGCHTHAAAGPYHYHNGAYIVYGRPAPVYRQPPTVYRQPPTVYQAPPPPPPTVYGGGYSPSHYAWCRAKAPNTYDPGSNSYIPYAGSPRVQCISPYM